MSRQLESYGINILKMHAAWLTVNGYKLQASSCKRQIRMILKKKKLKRQAPSFKPQAPSKKVLDSHKIPDIK